MDDFHPPPRARAVFAASASHSAFGVGERRVRTVAGPRGAAALDAVTGGVDERTLKILDRRRKTAVVRRRGWLVRRMLLVADLAGLMFAFVSTQLVFGAGVGSTNRFGFETEILLFVATLPAWVLLAKLYRLYDRDEERTDHSTFDDVVGVFHLVTVSTWLFFVLTAMTGVPAPELPRMVMFWASATALVPLARTAARTLARRSLTYLQNTVVVGTGEIGELIARKLRAHPEYGINLIGFVGREQGERPADLVDLPLLGPTAGLPELVDTFDVERVIVAFPEESDEAMVTLVRTLRQFDVQIDIVPRMFEAVGPSVGIHSIEGIHVVGLPPARLSRSSRVLKRAFDLLVAALALLVTAPLFALIAWRIKRDSPGPVLFRQARLGAGMKEFTVFKFRTMRTGTGDDEHREYIRSTMDRRALPQANGLYKLQRADEITNVGRWLRRTSLDELPQLINVLRGDMSLVGPRPCIPYETAHFAPHHFERFLVPAGLTGLWQVKARAHSTFAEALDLDVAYARSWSLGLDLRLLCMTPLQLLRGRGTA
jgi:exopolysaccharide biosynthesis polyprenyl glycosylphosphotransferase